MSRTIYTTLLSLLLLSIVGCSSNADKSKTSKSSDELKQFDVTIDWVPSPEYYGFFYAKESGYYKDIGLNVIIHNGSGAPVVANEIAAGAIYAGTTTSDNVLRQVARGAKFYKVKSLLTYNPSVVASLSDSPVKKIQDLNGKILGTNQQSSVYQQLLYLGQIGKISFEKFKEYPIGYGGAMQLKSREVNAILAYTTNVVVDLEKDGIKVNEIYLGDEGVATYGLVLAFGEESKWGKANITIADINNFIDATIRGYLKGADDVGNTIKALKKAEPTLDDQKITLAVKKIQKLNYNVNYPLAALDLWVTDDNITKDVRSKALALYK